MPRRELSICTQISLLFQITNEKTSWKISLKRQYDHYLSAVLQVITIDEEILLIFLILSLPRIFYYILTIPYEFNR